MKAPPKNLEFAKFREALKTMLKVSKIEMQRRIEDEKMARSKQKTSESESPTASRSLRPTSPALLR